MHAIERVIRNECLPMRDCMLTVQDVNGEAGFLYFKDAELIEANYASLWGKEAMGQILTWELAEHTVAPLPLGIKRSLWDGLESLLQARPSASDTEIDGLDSDRTLPSFDTASTLGGSEDSNAYQKFIDLPGVVRIYNFQNNQLLEEYISKDDNPDDNLKWLVDFFARARGIGDTLGMGTLTQFFLSTDHYHIIITRAEVGKLVIVRRAEGSFDDFESAVIAAEKE